MRIGIFAKTFQRPTIEELFQAIAGYGVYSVQFNLSCAGLETFPGNVSSDLVQRITDAAEQATVELAAISGTFNMAHPDPAVRRDGLMKFEILCEVTARLPMPVITLCTGTRYHCLQRPRSCSPFRDRRAFSVDSPFQPV